MIKIKCPTPLAVGHFLGTFCPDRIRGYPPHDFRMGGYPLILVLQLSAQVIFTIEWALIFGHLIGT